MHRLAGTALLSCVAGAAWAQHPATTAPTSPTWIAYRDAYEAGEPLPLPDYSHAGYALVPESVEPRDLPTLDVRGFGAVPDDDEEDFDAIQAAVRAAEEKGGAIVLFEPGRYLLNERPDRPESLTIHGDDIVLKGAAPDAEGMPTTELYMRRPMKSETPHLMWTSPPLIEFRPPPERSGTPVLARIVDDSPAGTDLVTVDRRNAVRPGDFVSLEAQDPEALDGLLRGLEPWDIWTTTIEEGIAIRGERHRIAEIDGGTLRLAEPLHTAVHARNGWVVRAAPMGRGWVVEDIRFRGEAPDRFVHHRSAEHDSGWDFLVLARAHGPVVRRCVFENGSHAVRFELCYGATAIHDTIRGRRGHGAISSGGSYGTLIALCSDDAVGGSFHGFGVEGGAVGTVIYRCKSSDRGFDWHASGPYCTLIDASSGGLVGNGGSVKLLPNHLHDLTLWNVHQTAGTVYAELDWWEPRKGEEQYGAPKIVEPRIIGFHGKPTTFHEASCLTVESPGKAVLPESLFEAQLELRLGRRPGWLAE